MQFDPVLIGFLEKFMLPVLTWSAVLFAFNVQGRSRKPHPMLLSVIGELVKTKTFTADNLINIGVLRSEPEPTFTPIDMLKLVRGG